MAGAEADACAPAAAAAAPRAPEVLPTDAPPPIGGAASSPTGGGPGPPPVARAAARATPDPAAQLTAPRGDAAPSAMLPSPILGALEARYLQDYRARAGRAARVGRAAPARGPRGPLTFRLLGGEVGYLPAAWLARLGEGELAGQLRGEGPCGRDPAGRPILACTPAAWRQVLTFLASGSVETPVSPAVVAEVRRLGYPQLTRRLLEHQGGVWVSRSAPPSLLRARVHLTGIVDELATSGTLERRLAGCDGRHWRLWVSRDALLLSPLRPHRRSGPPGLAARAGSVRLLAFDNASLRLPLRRVRGGDGLRATWSEGPRGLDELVSEGVARTPGAVLLDLEVWAAASAGTSGAL